MRRNRRIFVLVPYICLLVGALLIISGCGRNSGTGKAAQAKIMYHCPMHPDYTSDRQGDCPICGMKLVKMEPKAAIGKTPGEVCAEHKCAMNNCMMNVKTHIKPGEIISCPVCGEVISTAGGKVVEIIQQQAEVLKKERKPLYYRNPMNPQVTSQVPMKDSMGMDYVPVYEEAGQNTTAGATVTISPEKQQLIGVETTPVTVRRLDKIIGASGKIAYDPELVITQEEFIQALKNEENSKDSPLEDVIERARSLSGAARRKLKLLGMSDDQIVELEKTKKTQTNLYLPDKGENVWAYISIYEYEIGAVKPGDEVEIGAVAYPGEKFTGTVKSISPVLDAATRTNQVRVEVMNPDNKLKPEMFINAKIKAGLGEKLAVPESAVLDTGLRKIVYLSEENNTLESREIATGQKADGYYEVLRGLREGDMVVTSGNFLVDSESKLKAASQSAENK